jgi:hypothetical protein
MWAKPEHMQTGIAAAIKSPNTPAHLRPHLAKRLGNADPLASDAENAANDNLGPEVQRGMKIAPSRLRATINPPKKAAASPMIGGAMPVASASAPQAATAGLVNPFARRIGR